jgi:tetratricopeptide (TPR) repeat protein/CHAT domain-containing protein
MDLIRTKSLTRAIAVTLAIAVQVPAMAVAGPLAEATSLNQQAIALYQQGRYAKAELLYRRALAIREKALGPSHPDVAKSLNSLAGVYVMLGRSSEAEPLYERALAIREKVLGPEHPDVAKNLNNLAVLYQGQGRYAEAEPLHKRVLAILEKAFGPEHPDVATSLNNLAELYQDQGRYAEAEPLHKRVLAMREIALGPDHPDVATSLNNLAVLYQHQGRYAEAEPLYERALAIREKALGPGHPDVAASLDNLAGVYHDQGRYTKAEPLYKRALAIREKALGPEHPDVAINLNNLAELYQGLGRYAEAEPLHKRVLAILEKAFGPEHPEVATSLNNRAGLYQEQSRYAEAEPLYKRALAIREKALGPEHPDVATSLNNLAGVYHDQGRYTEAEPLQKRALAILEKALGPEHPDVATSLNNLAGLYRDQGRYSEAERLQKRALVIREKALGPEHPDVATSLNDLAGLYNEQGRYSEAEPLQKRALAVREKALGPEHPDVAMSLNNLAELYRDQGRYIEAEPLYERALAIQEKKLGPQHPYVANSLSNLAVFYHEQTRYAEAEPLYKRALTIRETALGPEHPDVAISLNNLAELYYDQGHHAAAEPLLKRALAIQENKLGPQHPNVANGLSNLAELYFDDGRLNEALLASAHAVKILTRHLSIGSARRSAAAVLEQRKARGYFVNYIHIADAVTAKTLDRRRATAADTFRVAQLAQASNAAQAVVGMAVRFAAGSDTLAAVVRKRQDLTARWQRLDAETVKAAGRLPNERNLVEEQALRLALEDTERQFDALDARIASEFPAYATLSNPRPLSVAAAQQLLASDEALLVYLTSNKETWLWVIGRDDVAFYPLGIGAEALFQEVRELRAKLDQYLDEDLAPFPTRRAHALFQKLLAPAAAELAGVRHILVVPDGSLQILPLGVLVTRPPEHDPQTPADHRDVAWLVRDYAITVVPSVSSLQALRRPITGASASAPFLGIGNPVLEGSVGRERGVTLASLFRGAVADADKVRSLPPLPETAEELRAIARTLGATDADLLLGERASEPVLRQQPLDRYRIIDFATHGLLSGDLPGLAEPALVLTPPAKATPDNDGLLTTSKIATLKLNADWVVLSACNTAFDSDGGGLSGLAKAFFYAGARSLLVSNWSVGSEETVKLITGTFAEFAKDPSIGRAEALRRSMIAMLDPANPPGYAHPAAWAPFILAGEGGAGR